MGILAHLRLRTKIAGVAVLAIGMSVLPATMIVRERLQEIRAAQAEAAGVPPAGALLKLLRLTQQHRGLSAMLLTVTALGQAQLLAQATALRDDWRPLTAAVAGRSIGGPASFTRHSMLVAA